MIRGVNRRRINAGLVALEKGFFPRRRFERLSLHPPTGQLALEEMLAGRANFATVGGHSFVARRGGRQVAESDRDDQ